MSKSYKFYQPNWYNGEPPEHSYRSVFKWGEADESEVLDEYLFIFLKEKYGLTNEDFTRQKLGLERVEQPEFSPSLSKEKAGKLKRIFGDKVSFEIYDRVFSAYGKSIEEINNLRLNIINKLPLAVIYAETEEDISAALKFAKENGAGVSVCGGRTNTANSTSANGNILIDMRRMSRVLKFNEPDQLITVEAGITGADLERVLSEAPENFDVNRRYTCGFHPAGFEMSTPGGWISEKAASEDGGLYGGIENVAVSMRVVTPNGVIDTAELSGGKSGLSLGGLFFGAEGKFGVISQVTLHFVRRLTTNDGYFAAGFKSFEAAQQAAREIMQSQNSAPVYLRVSDPDETAFLMDSKGVKNNFYNYIFKTKGLKRGEACILSGMVTGTWSEAQAIKGAAARARRRFKGKNLFSFSAKFFYRAGIDDPYVRETLQDFGFAAGMSERFVPYSQIPAVYAAVKEYIAEKPEAAAMTRLARFNGRGAAVQVSCITQINAGKQFKEFQDGLSAAFLEAGFPKEFSGKTYNDVKAFLKSYFDADNVLR